jgi:hypothetical protein
MRDGVYLVVNKQFPEKENDKICAIIDNRIETHIMYEDNPNIITIMQEQYAYAKVFKEYFHFEYLGKL